MHNYHLNRGPPRCALKVDIQKAYDTVDWKFLKTILVVFGFPSKMVDWIMLCVTTVTYSLSINGHFHGFFKGKRGLRQGDPLSPYLFTLVMEILTLILKRNVHNSASFSFHHYCQELQVINLCFADDLFIFMRGTVDSARVIIDSLDEFRMVSGLSASMPKSTAYFCNVLHAVKSVILSILPFEEGQLPVKYLGVPLVSSRLVVRDCKLLVDKVQKRVNDWRNKFLSFAGRVQLINSVLSSIHVYWSSVFILPMSVILDIEQIMRRFLWSQGDMYRGKAKVCWDGVCLPKEEGGLGIRKLRPFNVALFSVHIWNILMNKKSLWVKWIHTNKLRGMSFWNVPYRGNLSWSWRKMLQIRPIIRQFIWVNIGDGALTNVWYDNWCNNSPLHEKFSPREISSAGFSTDTKVGQLVRDGHWNVPLHWTNRVALFASAPTLSPNADGWFWKDKDGASRHFSVNVVWEDLRPRHDSVDWNRLVWFNFCIPRHEFILWLAFRQRLKTQDKLMQWDVWNKVNQKAGLNNRSCNWNLLVHRMLPVARKKTMENVIDKLIFAASVYFIWQERNSRLFMKTTRSSDVLADLIFFTVRMKMLTFKYKRKAHLERLIAAWDLPVSLLIS
uniref:uncharacterized protein LOC122597003 n=1 Tax=Erigeron canadensis TaxID=72917 RepID=UPI001CB9CDFB|nr:uncharacterized protein LOC122597003 [Erigeron canadensis]